MEYEDLCNLNDEELINKLTSLSYNELMKVEKANRQIDAELCEALSKNTNKKKTNKIKLQKARNTHIRDLIVCAKRIARKALEGRQR